MRHLKRFIFGTIPGLLFSFFNHNAADEIVVGYCVPIRGIAGNAVGMFII